MVLRNLLARENNAVADKFEISKMYFQKYQHITADTVNTLGMWTPNLTNQPAESQSEHRISDTARRLQC